MMTMARPKKLSRQKLGQSLPHHRNFPRQKSLKGLGRPNPNNPSATPSPLDRPLLRNLLLPEIRITVSNLSQAIRFLVDNDFLQNVELRPGQANEKLIEVLPEDEGIEINQK
ncbi:NUFIP1 domain-containing protein [Mycena venus]|uniref:NUFIP1 domain-containing protein n=1 Tax=Mycena venus TaxID=2733690 RepID=A0A8H6XWC4_9AGAR|nr:NUFIP1 domain-containing protein [Mycena venus]